MRIQSEFTRDLSCTAGGQSEQRHIHQLSVLAGRTMTGRLTVHCRIGVFADKRHKFDQGLLRGLLDSLHRNDSPFDPYQGIDMTYKRRTLFTESNGNLLISLLISLAFASFMNAGEPNSQSSQNDEDEPPLLLHPCTTRHVGLCRYQIDTDASKPRDHSPHRLASSIDEHAPPFPQTRR